MPLQKTTVASLWTKDRIKPFLTLEPLNLSLVENSVSSILFISSDGALLNNAFLSIDEMLPNQIALFLERNDNYNAFGTVIRIQSGSDVGGLKNIGAPDYSAVRYTI